MANIPIRPEDYGVGTPKLVDEKLFREGFEHSIQGGHMTDIKRHFKMSFREGFRAARLVLRNQKGKRNKRIPYHRKG